MRKKRVLMVTEASFFPTGYGVYTKNLLSRMMQAGIDVAEVACFTTASDRRINDVPWKVYANKPEPGTREFFDYESSVTAEFGEFIFNTACMDFQPDFVIDIRDPWVFEHQHRSPFRRFFKWCIMPTIDASPQNQEWIDMFTDADALFTYSEFGIKTLREQYDVKNFIDIASPCASDEFTMFNKEKKIELRNSLKIPNDVYIIGTVMRNQRRKLYPDLFKTFREFLEQNKTGKDVYLYCHTCFPDVGWNIPELLIEYNLSNRVLFTYKCTNCKAVTTNFFQDTLAFCKYCHNYTNNIAGISNGLNDEELACIYNTFDVYVQYANSEGFGMPQVEAARCGNVVCSTYYSAMQSVIDNIEGIPIDVQVYQKESETGCNRAIPSGDKLITILNDLVSKSRDELFDIGERTHHLSKVMYNWDITANKWIDYINNTPVQNPEDTWLSKPDIFIPVEIDHSIKSPKEQANFLLRYVLNKPELIGKHLWRKLIRDLTYRTRLENAGGYYFNESHTKDQLKTQPFSFSHAYDEVCRLREFYNTWENNRMKFYQ